ncbi:MAG: hypothetical protein M0Q41_10750 [Bacteroidales bacterium]|nr:hypothetical protein [Acholeplasmataceae bacterium]MCK9449440.1 hypothetical protein [Bacteroidales bacterium]
MATITPNKHGDLTDQQVIEIKKKVLLQAAHDEFFAKFAHKVPWKKGARTMSYRRLIYPKVNPADIEPLTEGVAPRPSKIGYATFQVSVENYGDKVAYTREAVQYNIDDVVRDAGETLSYIFAQKMDYIKGKPFISSRASVSYDTSIIKTMRNAHIILTKNKAKKWEKGHFLMLATAEVIEQLQDELTDLGTSLDEVTKEELARGIVGRKKGFLIVEVPSDVFHLAGGKHNVSFMGRTYQGYSPITVHQLGDIDVYNNPLGSGVLTDEDGNITADDNRQIGSVAMNADGLAAVVNDDLCILNCEITISTIAGSELSMSERTNYVSSSGESSLIISVTKALDGEALAGSTIVVKVKNSSGTEVSAESDGSYILTAGVKYYYSVALNLYTTVTGYFRASTHDATLVVPLTLAGS